MALEESRVIRTAVPIPDSGGLYRLGSGYLIGDKRVLTAAHVLQEASESPVLEGQHAEVARIGGEWLDASVAWVDLEHDVAVVSCVGLGADGTVPWGRLEGAEPIEWGAAGFPVASVDPIYGRQAEHAYGKTSAISDRAVGRLALTVQSREARKSETPWAGLSGAAVFCGDALVGVITADSGGYSRSLIARRIEDVCGDPRLANILGYVPALEVIVGKPSHTALPAGRAPETVAKRSRNRRVNAPKHLAEVADLVAIAVHSQWAYEATHRQLDDPYALSVQWSAMDPELVISWAGITKLASSGSGWPQPAGPWATEPSELAGSDNDLMRVLDLVPTRRLVVTGSPGAGKTILLVRLTLELLQSRRRGEPVPLILPLGSWNAAEDELNDWVETWLITNHPALAHRSPESPNLTRARSMLEAGLFLLILDGFDEMPELLRSHAVAKINKALLPGQALVLASRTDAFRDAVKKGPKVSGAAGVNLQPLQPLAIIDYLCDSADNAEAAERWKSLAEAIEANKLLPVAQVLTTPLMATLARAVYNPLPGESVSSIPASPTELLDLDRFPCTGTIMKYLFNAFLPAAYRKHPDPARRARYKPANAVRWLAFLATVMEYRQEGTTDFEWWRLIGAIPLLVPSLIVGSVVAAVGGWGIPYPGFGIGLLATAATVLYARANIHFGKQGLVAGLAGGVIGGQAAALIAILVFGTGKQEITLTDLLSTGVAFAFVAFPFANLAVAALGAFVGTTVTGFYEQSSAFSGVRLEIGPGAHIINGCGLGVLMALVIAFQGRRAPAKTLHWSFLGAFGGCSCGLIMSAVVWLEADSNVRLLSVLLLTIGGGVAGGLYGTAKPSDLTRAADPLQVLRNDRKTFLLSLSLGIPVGLGAIIAITPPGQSIDGYMRGLGIGIADVVAAGLALAFLQATWGYFALARLWLALSGEAPWRLISFLRDAHEKRGVLRRHGAVYQFRHIDVQYHLARESRELYGRSADA